MILSMTAKFIYTLQSALEVSRFMR